MMMKTLLLAGAILCFSGSVQAQTLFSYGKNQVDQGNFLRAFKKNNLIEPDKEKAIREYLDLYVNFKLKVQDAYEEGIDSLPQIVNDIQQFRQQITENYLDNKEGKASLEREAAERVKKDIRVQHYFVPVTETATAEERANAESAAQAMYEILSKEKQSDDELLKQITSKYAPARTSDLGYITVFSIPYAYENIVYNTAEGQVSKPYLNEKGWHLFKVKHIRNSAGRWKLAQILFSFPSDASDAYKEKMQKKADSVYRLLESGKMDFETAAKNFSNDRLTYMSGGEMPEFGTGKYTGIFEDRVFALKNNGDISLPFTTSFGIHIVKRLNQTPIEDVTDHPIMMMEIKQKIEDPDRMQAVNRQFKAELAEKIKFRLHKTMNTQELLSQVVNVQEQTNTDADKSNPIYHQTIGYIESLPITGKDWLNYIRLIRSDRLGQTIQSAEDIWNEFLHHKRMAFYRENLEQYNPEFKYQMEEFKEGNMLFEIMERKVWNKAIADTAGTQRVYESNKAKYLWQPSADMLIFNAHSEAAAQQALAALNAGKFWTSIAEESKGMIQADSGRYELDQIFVKDPDFKMESGAVTPMQTGAEGATSFVKILKLYPGNEQRKFEESKGLAISDYQNLLEKNWIDALKKKYPVKYHKKNINRMIKAEMK